MNHYWLKLRTPIMIGLDLWIKKGGYNWAVTKSKGREERKHFTVPNKLGGNSHSMIKFLLHGMTVKSISCEILILWKTEVAQAYLLQMFD